MNVYLAEFIGTAILILFGGGVCANVNLKRSAGQDSDWIVIAAGWGLAVSMGAYAVGKFSGAHLNCLKNCFDLFLCFLIIAKLLRMLTTITSDCLL